MGQFVDPKLSIIRKRVGESVSLPCQVPLGYPPPVVTWQTLKDAQLDYIKETSRLAIDIDGKFDFYYKHQAHHIKSIVLFYGLANRT